MINNIVGVLSINMPQLPIKMYLAPFDIIWKPITMVTQQNMVFCTNAEL